MDNAPGGYNHSHQLRPETMPAQRFEEVALQQVSQHAAGLEAIVLEAERTQYVNDHIAPWVYKAAVLQASGSNRTQITLGEVAMLWRQSLPFVQETVESITDNGDLLGPIKAAAELIEFVPLAPADAAQSQLTLSSQGNAVLRLFEAVDRLLGPYQTQAERAHHVDVELAALSRLLSAVRQRAAGRPIQSLLDGIGGRILEIERKKRPAQPSLPAIETPRAPAVSSEPVISEQRHQEVAHHSRRAPVLPEEFRDEVRLAKTVRLLSGPASFEARAEDGQFLNGIRKLQWERANWRYYAQYHGYTYDLFVRTMTEALRKGREEFPIAAEAAGFRQLPPGEVIPPEQCGKYEFMMLTENGGAITADGAAIESKPQMGTTRSMFEYPWQNPGARMDIIPVSIPNRTGSGGQAELLSLRAGEGMHGYEATAQGHIDPPQVGEPMLMRGFPSDARSNEETSPLVYVYVKEKARSTAITISSEDTHAEATRVVGDTMKRVARGLVILD